MGFLRQEYWSGVPFPTPGNLPNPGFKPMSFLSLALAGKFFISGSPVIHVQDQYRCLKTLHLGKTSGSQVTQKSRKSQQVSGLGKKVVGQISKWASQNGCIICLLSLLRNQGEKQMREVGEEVGIYPGRSTPLCSKCRHECQVCSDPQPSSPAP